MRNFSVVVRLTGFSSYAVQYTVRRYYVLGMPQQQQTFLIKHFYFSPTRTVKNNHFSTPPTIILAIFSLSPQPCGFQEVLYRQERPLMKISILSKVSFCFKMYEDVFFTLHSFCTSISYTTNKEKTLSKQSLNEICQVFFESRKWNLFTTKYSTLFS